MASAGAYRFLHDFWEAPHRPLFSAAILCALLTVAWWPLGVWLGVPGPAFEPAVVWHVHELVFGFAAAAIGGYLLTALPNWTGQPPVRGRILKTLMLFWLSARLAMALAAHIPSALPVAFNGGYFLLLTGLIGHQLCSARAYRKLGVLIAVAALGVAEVLFLGTVRAGMPWASLAIAQPVLIGLVMLMVSIGARAVPAFTDNWLIRNGRPVRTRSDSAISLLPTQTLLAIAIVTRLTGQPDIAGFALIGAALALLWNMRKWHCLTALSNPLLAALHLAFLWLPVGLAVLGISGLAPAIYPMTDAIHAITIGGMSGLIMAISGRAAAHTQSGDMQANPGFTAGFLLIWIATWLRLAAPVIPGFPVVMLAAATWCMAWIAFAAGFLPALSTPLRRPVLSGQRHAVLAEIRKAERMEQ